MSTFTLSKRTVESWLMVGCEWTVGMYYVIQILLFFSLPVERPTQLNQRSIQPGTSPHKMGTLKKSQSPSKSKSSTNGIHIKKVKGENFYKNAKTVKLIKMRNGGKPVYDRNGKIKEAAAFQKTEKDAPNGRVEPDKRWFGTLWCCRFVSQLIFFVKVTPELFHRTR